MSRADIRARAFALAPHPPAPRLRKLNSSLIGESRDAHDPDGPYRGIGPNGLRRASPGPEPPDHAAHGGAAEPRHVLSRDLVRAGAHPTSLTRGCEYATTEHGRDTQGRITVRDACRQDGPQGRERALSGIGTVLDPGQNAVLDVRYRFGPFRPTREYRVIAAGSQGEWFVSSEPEFDKVYVFTRAVAPPRTEVDALIGRVRALGYSGEIEVLATPGRD
uniref:Lipocalin family protein n=1 Tax=Phenylobacterium glaciei TaxID=2803784 RepID=A0A974SAN2_9CAUL|nr:lipocalin family protein [Phenylobacterium glaciei]